MRRRRRRTALIKSNNHHVAGGEKCNVDCIDVVAMPRSSTLEGFFLANAALEFMKIFRATVVTWIDYDKCTLNGCSIGRMQVEL